MSSFANMVVRWGSISSPAPSVVGGGEVAESGLDPALDEEVM